ncbi:unnamed protein product [Enterobius vermicularis]|uniref:Neur_chan_LBD domain-containing protein n=1 Tax=Enterobius vermicularis TaxID=51028 RepID=A0A0N4VK69_ENTVE|nr:unnamed protein product [Enterobius vermicularis]
MKLTTFKHPLHCTMLLLLLILAVLCCCFSCLKATESELVRKVLKGYEILERPVPNAMLPLRVSMGIVLQQIIQVDEKNQIVDANVWIKLSWYDYKIKWDPRNYSGIKFLRLKKDRVWTPDILMYNSAHRQFDAVYMTDVVADYNGLMKWKLPGIFKLTCTVNIVWFPFDEQQCFMKFGSWTYDGSKLNLTEAENSFDTSNYMDNGEWILKNTSVTRAIRYYTCCPEPYYDMEFQFTLKRRTEAYAFNLLIPCSLLTMLTLVGFIVPPEAGEKVSYQVSLMLSICIFQNYVSEMSPPTSEALPFLDT